MKANRQKSRSEGRDGGSWGELTLLNHIRARAAQASGSGLRLGIGDDCALLAVRPGEELAVTTDLSIAGRHFRLDWHPPEAVGHRTLARGLSDLAAMGARPVAAFLSLGLPRDLVQSSKAWSASRETGPNTRPNTWPNAWPNAWLNTWIGRFYDGFLALAEAHKTPLAGGDLAESPVAAADIVLIGAVPRGRALLRSGARPGDQLYVTGSLGGAAAGFARLAQFAGAAALPRTAGTGKRAGAGDLRIPKKLQKTLAPHLYPQPRLAQGLALMRRGLATAALDLSDGLSTDLAHLCAESNVTAEVNAAALPIHPDATLEQALHGGEDYELLFTGAPGTRVPHTIAGLPITLIGRVVRRRAGRPAVTLATAKGTLPLEKRGWEHFS